MTTGTKTDRFDGHCVELFVDEDGDWLAHFAELPNVSGFAPTKEKALDELAIAWDLVKESYVADGEPIPIATAR
jgi:predicted RNase H-like HicB family nuclease